MSAADARLAQLYATARNDASESDKIGIVTAQKAWVAQRNKCSDTECLTEAYKARIAQLSADSGSRPSTTAKGDASTPAAPGQKTTGASEGTAVDWTAFRQFSSQFAIKGLSLYIESVPPALNLKCASWNDQLLAAANAASGLQRSIQWEMLGEHAALYSDGPGFTKDGFSNGLCGASIDSYANKRSIILSAAVVNGAVLSVSIAADSDAIRFAVDSFAKTAGVPVTVFSTQKTKVTDLADRFYKGEFKTPDPYQPQLDKAQLALVARKCGDTCDETVYGFVTAPVVSPIGPIRLLVRATVSPFHDWYLSGTDQDTYGVFGSGQPDQYGYLTVCLASVKDAVACSGSRTSEMKNVAEWKKRIKELSAENEGSNRKKDM